MSKDKTITCKQCGAELTAKAVACPKCGVAVKNQKPFYKRGWFIALCVVVVLAIIGSAGSSGEPSTTPTDPDVSTSQQGAVSKPEIEYTVCTADDMIDLLDSNALKAENTYNDAYVEVTGRLANIDSDGDYISLDPIKDSWSFNRVMCYIKNDTQLQQVMDMSIGDKVTVRGQIKSVGEVLGYTLNIIEIVE